MSNLSIAEQVRNAVESENLIQFIGQHLLNGFLSLRAVAAMCGVEHTSIIRSGAFASTTLAKKLEAHGFEAGALAENGFPPAAVWLTIEYFAYDSKAEAPVAKVIARTFGAVGVKTAFAQIEAPTPENQVPAYHQPPVNLPSTEQRLAALIDVLERAKSVGFDPSDPRSAHGVNEQVARILLSDSPASPVGPVSPANTITSTSPKSAPMPLVVDLEKHLSTRELARIWVLQGGPILLQGGPTLRSRKQYLNKRLLRSGFQWRNKSSGLWVPTEKAAPYVKVAGYELLWLPTVLSNFRLNARTTQRK
jgi:hypothetical protein